jgi:hypothetical protein
VPQSLRLGGRELEINTKPAVNSSSIFDLSGVPQAHRVYMAVVLSQLPAASHSAVCGLLSSV